VQYRAIENIKIDKKIRPVKALRTFLGCDTVKRPIKSADYIIDMGPEGGDGGGQVIARGTPEEVSTIPESYTGQFLKPYLKDSGE
jgi:hypothetical protein